MWNRVSYSNPGWPQTRSSPGAEITGKCYYTDLSVSILNFCHEKLETFTKEKNRVVWQVLCTRDPASTNSWFCCVYPLHFHLLL